ncbi:ras GTPase-activating protein-binding protein 2 [Rhynchophorus ferrugineus]|uniref:Ras GTPase-activating protein-binding protein 2 n=1 Tax=Rhynchophorus ferrugineus TaxID=354439 RepID=A0A834MD68_RHYFE|nr:hypothetical protein GWI33_013501 [Rhynchophorus ferrugineus]
MVMEDPPSPQSVGREFVRQYYTLLNKAPTHLHRFYNHQSSFIHGGLDPPNRETIPVVGQKQIHQKIQQLNFRDCHAKITQVDSQSTLGSGVVVQVTGELSNAGQPMRRFTQTFVLASQSPKKYYVHNDIFRYQDEIISDEECDGDGRSEPEEDIHERPPLNEPQPPLGQPIAPAPGLPPFYGGAVPPTGAPVPPMAQPPTAAPHQAPVPIPHVLPPQQAQMGQPPQQATLNGHPEDLGVLPGQPLSGHIPPVQQPLMQTQQPSMATQPINPAVPVPIEEPSQEPEEQVDEPLDGGYADVAEIEPEQDVPQEPASNEPKTYANLLKSVSSGPTQPAYSVNSYRPQSPPTMTNRGPVPTNGTSRPGGPRPAGGQPPRSGPPQNRGPRTADDDDRRRSQSSTFGPASDAHQLFLGNLPHAATEEELREIFSEFGPIVDLKVHSKQAPAGAKPGQGGRAPPNYGFITYENSQSITNCLAAKPIFYPKNSNATMLNVEEKKNKERDGGRPPYGGNSGGRPGQDNSRPGGGRGDMQRRSLGSGGPRGGQQGGPGDRNRSQGDRVGYNRSGGPANRGGSNNTYRR